MASTPSQFGLNENLIQMLLGKHEGNKDRNLKAAIADRQFQDASKDRLLKRMLSREETGLKDRLSERSAVTKMKLAEMEGGEDGKKRAESQILADVALAKLRDAKATREYGREGREAEKQPVTIQEAFSRIMKNTSQANTEDALRDGRYKNLQAEFEYKMSQAAKNNTLTPVVYDQIVKDTEAKMREQDRKDMKLPSEIDKTISEAERNRSSAAYNTAGAQGRVRDTARRDEMQPGALLQQEADLGKTQASTEVAKQRGRLLGIQADTAWMTQPFDVQMAKQAVEESNARVLESQSRIKHAGIRAELERVKFGFQQLVHEENMRAKARGWMLQAIELAKKVNPIFGKQVIEEDSETGIMLDQMIKFIRKVAVDKGELNVVKDMDREYLVRTGQLKGTGGEAGTFASDVQKMGEMFGLSPDGQPIK